MNRMLGLGGVLGALRRVRDGRTRVSAMRPFDPQPALRGDLVELRPLAPQDFDALYAVACDPLIWEQHPERERWQEDRFRVFFQEAIASGGALLALDRLSGRVIGSSRYHGYDADRSEIEIGWSFLARSHWGGRYNGEMKTLMLEHAFKWVDRVLFVIGLENQRSQRAVEKIGAYRIGVRTDPTGAKRALFEITAKGFSERTRPGSRARGADREGAARPR